MISSFLENSYGDLIKSIVVSQKPRLVIEYGILFGYSTTKILEGLNCNGFGQLISNDMFEDFPYNHAEEKMTRKMFSKIDNIEIRKSDFYKIFDSGDMTEITLCDLFLVDIGNLRKTYEFFVDKIYQKLKPGSIAILEGGSSERDNYYKSKGYSEESISDYLKSVRGRFVVFGSFPSITVFSP